MPAASTISRSLVRTWTVADLQRRFGPMPFHRILPKPAPGTATESDVLWLNDHENRLCELVDGVLVEKTVGYEESWLALRLASLILACAERGNLGIVTGADGMYRLSSGLVRIPDVAFISWGRIPGGTFPEQGIPDLVPDLAVEVLSAGNTRKEMEEKLRDYFGRGVVQVWLVRPRSKVVDVYTAADHFARRTSTMTLEGGDVLPGFSILVADLFRKPRGPQPRKLDGSRSKH